MKRSRTSSSAEGMMFLREEALFTRALKLPFAARARFLDTACRRPRALRERVAALLRAHDRADGFLDRPAMVRRRSWETRDRAS